MVLAAEHIGFKMNRLVSDAGTCVTYDFIDEKDNIWWSHCSRIDYAMKLYNYTMKTSFVKV
jgi:hypothetical protein